jgi:glycerol kinase
VLDPYFSGTKMQWLLGPGGVPAGPDLAMGTVDAWLLWNLTGGIANGVFATDSTNASRTMLFDIVDRRWSDELCDLFAIPMAVLPEVHPSCGRFGLVDGSLLGGSSPIAGVPVSAMAGDQHAALFGQACFDPGMVKATIGTGSFILMNAGAICPEPVDGLLTTIAWDLGADGGDSRTAGRDPFAYAVEGSVFVAGAGVQWLRDGLGIITGSSDLEPLARTVDSSEGVVIVPAFTGLGSPQWDPSARGTIVGLSRGSGRAQVARAMIEAMGFQARDVLDAMCTTGTRPSVVRVDGGAAVMDLLLEHLADQARLDVLRPRSVESTAIGAATMAGLAEGVWSSLDDLAELWDEEAAFSPAGSDAQVEIAHEAWLRAVERSRGWTGDAD